MSPTSSIYSDQLFVRQVQLTVQKEEEGYIIGNQDTGVFLAVPEEAIQLMSWFKDGHNIGEVKILFQEKYNENPDLQDFLEMMVDQGLIRVVEPNEDPEGAPFEAQFQLSEEQNQKFHFKDIDPRIGGFLFGKPMMMLYGLMVAVAVWLLLKYPAIVPARMDLVFRQNVTFNFIFLNIIVMFTVFLHEMAHLLAARAQNISCRLGISNRMWYVVAETDMTGVWSLPRAKRFLPFLAGPIFDIVFAALMVFGLAWVEATGLELSVLVKQFLRALLLTTVLRIVWQCYFYMRTDFYFVFGAMFNCKNLMEDTTTFLKNKIKQIRGKTDLTDQSSIPPREFKIIHYYAFIWVFGRAISISFLILIVIPVMYTYFTILFDNIMKGFNDGVYVFLDSSVVIILSFFTMFLGMGMWIFKKKDSSTI